MRLVSGAFAMKQLFSVLVVLSLQVSTTCAQQQLFDPLTSSDFMALVPQGLQDMCHNAGYYNVTDLNSRFFNDTDCLQVLQGRRLSNDDICYKMEGGSYSYDCRWMNPFTPLPPVNASEPCEGFGVLKQGYVQFNYNECRTLNGVWLSDTNECYGMGGGSISWDCAQSILNPQTPSVPSTPASTTPSVPSTTASTTPSVSSKSVSTTKLQVRNQDNSPSPTIQTFPSKTLVTGTATESPMNTGLKTIVNSNNGGANHLNLLSQNKVKIAPVNISTTGNVAGTTITGTTSLLANHLPISGSFPQPLSNQNTSNSASNNDATGPLKVSLFSFALPLVSFIFTFNLF